MKKKLIGLIVCFLMATLCLGQQKTTDTLTWTLDRCIETALAHNITIKSAGLDQSSAETRLKQASAARYPSLNVSASQNISNYLTDTPSPSFSNSTNAGLNAQMILYQGNQVNQEIRQNKLLVQQQALWLEEAKNSISLCVAQIYIQALFYKEGIGIAQNDLASSQQQLEQTQARFDVGSVSSRELAEVQSQKASGQYNLIAMENAYQQQLFDLKQLLELDPATRVEIVTPADLSIAALIVPEMPQIYSTALAVLPEAKSDNLQLDISSLDIKMARAGYLPSLSLGAGLSTGYSSGQSNYSGDALSGSLGLTLSIPILDQRQTRTNVQIAGINLEKAHLQQQTSSKEIYRKIERAWQDFMATRSQAEAAVSARTASETSYKLAQQQFDLGGLSATDLLTAQNTFMNAEQKLLQVKYNNVMNYLLLQYYQGKSLKISL